MVQVKHDSLKLNGTHQLLVYADNVNTLGGKVLTIKKITEALVVASHEFGLEVNADNDNTKCMVISRDLNAGRRQNIKFHNNFFERVEEIFGNSFNKSKFYSGKN